jgi:SAM-dependent methyltransferase
VTAPDYNKTYNRFSDYFGRDPDPLLVDHYHLINRSGRVLDVGAGQGRQALFLARQGFGVDAIDPSREAIKTLAEIARSERLAVRTFQRSFDTFFPDTSYYSAILLFGLLQILTWDQIDFLTEMVEIWTHRDSLLFVTAWTLDDPSVDACRETWKTIGRNSFESPAGEIRTFLERNEILKVFHEYENLHHREALGPLHRHGDSPPEQHGRVEAVFRKNR